MSWLFSRVLVEEFLEANSLDGEQSVPLNGNPTPQAYCAPDKTMAFSRLSRFGMTFKPLTENHGEELLTLYLAGFHAKTLAQQEKVMDSMENAQECGGTWRAWLAKYDPNTFSWKTPQCSLLGEEQESLETLPRWGMTVGGLLWELPTLEPTTKEIGYGSLERLPTPQSTDYRDKPTSKSWKEKGGVNFSLANPELRVKWPTPKAIDGIVRHSKKMMEKKFFNNGDVDLTLAVKMNKWPTPVTRDYKDTGTHESMIRAFNKRDSPGLALTVGAETGGQLNPTWVEWLMGWPLGWTDLKPLEMDKSPCVQQPHGNGSQDELL